MFTFFAINYAYLKTNLSGYSQVGSNLESWGTAAPVDLHQVAVTDALVETRTGQTGVTLGQHFSVHIS